MPEKKPTDNEIVKALEWYVSKFKTVGFVYMDADGTHLIGTQDVLDLINRQKAEIERLKAKIVEDDKLLNDRVAEAVNTVNTANQKYVDALEEALKEKATEIDRLEKDIKTLNAVIAKTFLSKAGLVVDALAEIKAEAYKEFAERFKKKLSQKYTTSLCKVYCEEIDNLLKELIGE